MRAYGSRVSPVAGVARGPAHRGAAGRPRTPEEGAADASAGATGNCARLGGEACQGPGTDGPAFHGPRAVPAARRPRGPPDCPPRGTCRAPGCRTRAAGPDRGRAADLAAAAPTTAGAPCRCSAASDPDPDIAGGGCAP